MQVETDGGRARTSPRLLVAAPIGLDDFALYEWLADDRGPSLLTTGGTPPLLPYAGVHARRCRDGHRRDDLKAAVAHLRA